MSVGYEEFIASKRLVAPATGIDREIDLSPSLFPFQADIVRWALRRGRAAIWADCGLGKSWMALEWAREVAEETEQDVLITTPLAVAAQFVREGAKMGIEVTHCREGGDVRPGINVTNYERLHKLDTSRFGGIVLDESSILKDYTSSTRNQVIEAFARTPFRLACTATPAPNDHMELGNHAEFLGVMSRTEMLAMFFCHDGGSTQDWRLKGHAVKDFWRWVTSWACAIRAPSDLGYSDDGFTLPPLHVREHVVSVGHEFATKQGNLFAVEARGLSEQREARRASLGARVKLAAAIISDKLATCPGGSQSISETGNEKSPPTQSMPQGLPPIAAPARQKKTRSTCEPTTSPTRRNLDAEPRSNESDTTPREERDTNPTDDGGTLTSSRSRSGKPTTLENAFLSDSGSTELQPNSTPDSCSDREDDAQSAKPSSLRTKTIGQIKTEDCTSTIATKLESSEGCCARPAILGSANSEIIPSDLNAPWPTYDDQWIVWVDLNDEGDAVQALIPGSVQVSGSDSTEFKEQAIADFLEGKTRVLISKSSIFGFGLNLQCCSHVAYVGLSHSFEAWYQSIRRVYRFGQKREVFCHMITSDAEGAVVANLKRKQGDADKMVRGMVAEMGEFSNVGASKRDATEYNPTRKMTVPAWIGMEP